MAGAKRERAAKTGTGPSWRWKELGAEGWIVTPLQGRQIPTKLPATLWPCSLPSSSNTLQRSSMAAHFSVRECQ